MNIKRLYHGSVYLFDEVEVSKGKGYKDFGKGFYTSGIKSHAVSLALRNKQIEIERLKRIGTSRIITAYLYEFDFDMDLISRYNSKIFGKDADLEWAKFVDANRDCATKTHDFDIVIGATADDDTALTFGAYRGGVYGEKGSLEALTTLIKHLEVENLPAQIYFGSQKAANNLILVKRSEVR